MFTKLHYFQISLCKSKILGMRNFNLPRKKPLALLETSHCGDTIGIPRDKQHRNLTVLLTCNKFKFLI
jgi:hypothetical protein